MPTDAMLARFQGEIEEKTAFIDGVVEDAEKNGRDLTAQELELLTRAKERIAALDEQVKPLIESRRIAGDSRERIAQITAQLGGAGAAPPVIEYRSAGEYVIDVWQAKLGHDTAARRLEVYHRAAAHQTTADNPGLIPTPIVGPVVNFIDASRPFVNWLGPRQLPSGSWSRPKVTQHTQVGVQSAEKNELASRKMTITKTAVTPSTYGGYVNVSRQDIDWTVPGIMDIVINDLAGQYAIQTEAAAGAAALAGATAGATIPTGTPTAAALNAALWDAASKAYTATAGQGSLAMFISPDMLAMWGALFAPVNPTNAISSGFSAANFGTGPMGAISGIPVYMSNGLAAGTNLVVSSAAMEAYEDRVGSLQVIEPSVLGVQVAYAGYFTQLIIDAGGVIKIVKTP